jgi:hypothetical protein
MGDCDEVWERLRSEHEAWLLNEVLTWLCWHEGPRVQFDEVQLVLK